MTEKANTFKIGGSSLTEKAGTGYQKKMGDAVDLLKMFQKHGLTRSEMENFAASTGLEK